jgi:hypothetical protein
MSGFLAHAWPGRAWGSTPPRHRPGHWGARLMGHGWAPCFLRGGMGIDREVFSRMYPPAARPVAPIQRLATAVVHQAVTDLRSPEASVPTRARAASFIASESFIIWCRLTEVVDPEAARARLLADGLPPGTTSPDATD